MASIHWKRSSTSRLRKCGRPCVVGNPHRQFAGALTKGPIAGNAAS